MSGGFASPIIGGGGALVYPAIHSPDYVPGVSGWSVSKDGTAEFRDIILPAGTSITVTFAPAAPASPHTGDLWYDTSHGLRVSQWDGSAWTAYQIGAGAIAPGSITAAQIAANTITAAQLAANTITAAQLAAGIVYAGIVNGTVIEGSTFVLGFGGGSRWQSAAPSSPGFFMYYDDGTDPVQLFFAVAAAAGTDSFGNTYQQGTTIFALATATNALSVADASGNTLAALDTSGNITGQTLSAGVDLIAGGSSLLSDIIPGLSKGVINTGWCPGTGTAFPWPATAISSTETALAEIDQDLTGGRAYQFSTTQFTVGATAGTPPFRCEFNIHYTNDGSTPTTSSPVLGTASVTIAYSGTTLASVPPENFIVTPSVDGTWRFLITALTNSSSAAFKLHGTLGFQIVDLGLSSPQITNNSAVILGSGSSGGSGGKQTYTKYYTATHTYSYQGSDGHQPNALIDTDGRCYQGGDYADTYNGKTKTWILFDHSAIAADLAGASINWTKLRLNNNHTWYNNGGYAAVGWDTKTSFGSTAADPSGANIDVVEEFFSEGQQKAFYVPFGTDFRDNGATSLVLFKNSNSLTYYGYWAGAGQSGPPQLIVNYTK